MNIQIFGKTKCFETKKAERYFKERGIRYQLIDLPKKGFSKGEFTNICQAVGGWEKLLDPKCKDQDTLALVRYLAPEDRMEKLLENPQLFCTPVVRNGRQATVGFQPEQWKSWE